MKIIPIQFVPSQIINVQLAGQDCTINLYAKSTGVFLDLSIAGTVIISGAICVDRVNAVRYGYLGFVGGLAICDTQGFEDPQWAGFGSRFQLVYLEASDL